MPRFPFVVARKKAVVVEAPSLPNAIDRVLLRHQGKWIKVNYARNVQRHLKPNSYMDLISAQKQVKEDSKKKKNELFYIILMDDEFEIHDHKTINTDKDNVYSVWRGGIKIDAPEGKKEPDEPVTKKAKPAKRLSKQIMEEAEIIEQKEKSKTENKMSTKTKSAKKSAAKKVAAKKTTKAANGTAKREFEPGKVISISVADMLKNVKKGTHYYRDPQGVRLSENWLKQAKQDRVRKVIHEYKETK